MESFYRYYKEHPGADFVLPDTLDEDSGNIMRIVNLDSNKMQNNLINILNLPISEESNYF